jgi:hypothetical protein
VITIVGCLLTRDGLSQGREAGYRRRTRSWASSALELRSVQKSRVALNIDHNDQLELGQVIALHRSKQGDVWALSVADSENADRLLEFDRPLYYSAGVNDAPGLVRCPDRARFAHRCASHGLTTAGPAPPRRARQPRQLEPRRHPAADCRRGGRAVAAAAPRRSAPHRRRRDRRRDACC